MDIRLTLWTSMNQSPRTKVTVPEDICEQWTLSPQMHFTDHEDEIMKSPPVEPPIESARPPTGDIWFSITVLALLLVCVLGTIVSTVLALTRLHNQPFHPDPMIVDLSRAFDGLTL
jgi:hypothetical protein